MEILTRYPNLPSISQLEDKDAPDINPKELVSDDKVDYSCIPLTVLADVNLAMLEGALKHGENNFLASPIKARTYYKSTLRHLNDWWRGRDIDPTCDVHEITKAIASLVVLRAAMINGNFEDNRPPKPSESFFVDLEARTKKLKALHNKNPRHYTIADTELCRNGK